MLKIDMEEATSGGSSNNSACGIAHNNHLIVADQYLSFGIFLLLSLVIILVLCFSQQRAHLCLKCCWGRPSLAVPMNFLISPRYRLPYILVFVIMADNLYQSLLNLSTPNSEIANKVYLNILYKILILPLLVVLSVGLTFLPLFACVEASKRFFGHCLGLFYSVLWFANILLQSIYKGSRIVCNAGNDPFFVIIYIFQNVPVLLVCLCVVFWYAFQVTAHCVRFLRHRHQLSISSEDNQLGLLRVSPTLSQSAPIQQQAANEVRKYHLLRVKKLLSRTSPIQLLRGRLVNLLIKVGRYFFPYHKYIRLPLPFLCVVAAMIMFLYLWSITLISLGLRTVHKFSVQYEQYLKPALNITGKADDLLAGIFVGLPVVFALSPFVSLLICSFLLLHMVGSISKLIKSVAREGFTETLPGKLGRVPSAWTYLGIQFGLFIYAWIIYFAVSFLVGVVIIVLIVGFKFFTSYFVNVALVLIIPLVWARVIFYLQFLLCKFVFFEDSQGKFVSITNQRLFNWLAFLLFLYNGFAGFVGAIVRVIISMVITLVLVFRLDTVTVPHSFKFLDFGHRAFLGFMYLYYTYNNAVVHTFIYLLTRRRRHQEMSPDCIQSDSSPLLQSPSPTFYGGSERRRLNCNRWLVAYTLLRNPSIQELTASNIAARKRREEATTPPAQEDDTITNFDLSIKRDEV